MFTNCVFVIELQMKVLIWNNKQEKDVLLINELVKLPSERSWLEFKKDNYKPEMIGEDISAPSNSAAIAERGHAYMLWGVDNNTRDIVGTKYDLQTLKKGKEELENWLRHKLSDNVNFEFHYV